MRLTSQHTVYREEIDRALADMRSIDEHFLYGGSRAQEEAYRNMRGLVVDLLEILEQIDE
jgi:hypothetical protein